jgi:hypothetical protein
MNDEEMNRIMRKGLGKPPKAVGAPLDDEDREFIEHMRKLLNPTTCPLCGGER